MDKFDEIWKNRFNEGGAPNDDWGSPDDLVWDGIDEHLKKDSKRKSWIWFWWGTGLMVLMLGTFMFAFKGEKKDRTTNVSDKEKDELSEVIIEKSTDALANSSDLVENKSIKKEDLPLSENPLFTKKINQKPETLSQSKLIYGNSNESKFLFKPKSKTASQNPILENFSLLESTFVTEKVSITDLKNINRKVDEFVKLQSIKAFLLNDSGSNSQEVLVLPNIESVVSPIAKTDRFFIALEAGAVSWKHRISAQYTSALSPFEFVYSDNFGWQTALTGGVAVGKYFEVNTGVRLEKIRVSSGHNSEINYSPAAEIAGRQSNDYSLSLATPYGLSPADFVLNRTANVGGDDVDLKVDFNSGHNITNIQIPAGIRFYPFGKRQKLTAFAEVGTSFNFLTKVTNEIESIDTHHDAIKFTDSGQAFTEPEITKEFYDLRFGGGLVYKFSKQLKFNLSYDYSRGLNPVFEQDNYKTVIDRQHISLGMISTF